MAMQLHRKPHKLTEFYGLQYFVKNLVCVLMLITISCSIGCSVQRRDEKALTKIIAQMNDKEFSTMFQESSLGVKLEYSEKEFVDAMQSLAETTGKIDEIKIWEQMAMFHPEEDWDKYPMWTAAYEIKAENGTFIAVIALDNSEGKPQLFRFSVNQNDRAIGLTNLGRLEKFQSEIEKLQH